MYILCVCVCTCVKCNCKLNACVKCIHVVRVAILVNTVPARHLGNFILDTRGHALPVCAVLCKPVHYTSYM